MITFLIALQLVNLVLLVLVWRLAKHAIIWAEINNTAINHYGAISSTQLRKLFE